MRRSYLYLLLIIVTSLPAGEADVLDVVIKHSFDDVYEFNVSVKHDDQGWDHYANGWEVLTPGGETIDVRVLHHPHKNEQPFTRSMYIKIPQDISEVTVRAHDNVHEYGGQEKTLKIPGR
ncbi:MAG: hypothetical protein AB8D52_00205 [Gammaproteobacteria bacterium]